MTKQFFDHDKRQGQSLIEILVAITIGVIILGVAVGAIVASLKLQSNAGRAQTATALGGELLENIRAWSETNWGGGIGVIATGTSNIFTLSTTSPVVAISGTELISIGTSTYTRYFYVNDVRRSSVDGQIQGGGSFTDPSTKQVVIVYGGPFIATRTISVYLTRYRNETFKQSDWSGGPNQNGPLTASNDRFSTSSSNVNYASTTGSVQLNLP